jgi:hypothetical protein
MLPSALARRPEVELLLCCARTTRPPEATAKIASLLQESMDWEFLLRTAHKHGVTPLLYWHLEATYPEAVPAKALDRLRDHFRTNSLRNLFLTGELLKLLNKFRAHEIPVVPYKGPALAASVYGNLALREFKDLDILVHRRNVPKAKEVLAAMGYQARYRLTRAQEAAFLRSQCEHPFTRDDGKAIVELHWDITERHFFPFDTEGLWERLTPIPLGSDYVLNPSPEDMLLILCVHGSRHAWERLAWICDLAELVRVHQEDVGWERVTAQASALGGERMLLLGLLLANYLMGATLPGIVSQRVQNDPTVEAMAERICEQLFQDTEYPTGLREGGEGAPAFHTLHLEVRRRLQDKIHYCIRKATTLSGEDWELLPLPRFLFPVYSMLRLIRLARKYGPGLLQRLL